MSYPSSPCKRADDCATRRNFDNHADYKASCGIDVAIAEMDRRSARWCMMTWLSVTMPSISTIGERCHIESAVKILKHAPSPDSVAWGGANTLVGIECGDLQLGYGDFFRTRHSTLLAGEVRFAVNRPGAA